MAYGQKSTVLINEYAKNKNAVIVDLRSDTITKPSKRMREAIFNAEVGDDVYEEDPTVKELESKAASLLGKEAGLFVTSGTMGNLVSIMCHCNVRGSEMYCGEDSHIALHEQGGAAQVAGVTICTLPNNSNGTFDLEKLETKFRKDRLHEPISKLVSVENTFNGNIVPQAWIEELAKLTKKYNLKLHMDGARLWNASIGSGVDAKEIVSTFDSVTFCLNKGLGAPVGAVLCGSTDFIANARRVRKVLGGGMRQVGIIAAAGLVSLEETIPLLKEDHRRAREIAQIIQDLKSPIFSVDMKTVQTNMLFLHINSNSISSFDFLDRLHEVADDNKDDRVIVRALALSKSSIRLVFHRDITEELFNAAVRKIKYVIKNYKSEECN